MTRALPQASASQPRPLVYVVLLNWNGAADTIDCLTSLGSVTYPNWRVVVVDNASTDDSVARLRQAFPDIPVLVSARNLGFAGGNNLGLEYALAQGADYLFLLNNDTTIAPDAVDTLVDVAEQAPDVGIVGAKIYYAAQPRVIWELYNSIDWARGRVVNHGHNETDTGQFNTQRPVDCVSGCALLIRRSVAQQVGLLDTRYFLYFEDVDWCVRVTRAGYRCVCVPSAVVWHKISMSTRGRRGDVRVHNHYHFPRSQIIFMRTHAPGWAKLTFVPYFIGQEVGVLARIIGSGLLGKPRVVERLKAVLAGCLAGLNTSLREPVRR